MKPKQLILPLTIYNQIVEDCSNHLPYESCGLVTGLNHRVNKFWPLENELKSSKRYFVSKQSLEAVMNEITQTGEQVLAIYHTHPVTAPVPSYLDLKNHPDPFVYMMIISFKLETPLCKLYSVENNRYMECDIIFTT
ncbi:Mov34/MPN/PAD-1 family protein [Alkalibacillus almallahensis]|uniref:Mov34/MPN/PAD-1 family protein n=1 Tax=Alkalibacillus almallahensis TaxID=1379154 RepID=UPI001420D08F|nr:Mov34/MPN/PAD-1 family protein [Alkalibacillus almallahensis]NIK12266.1 proteasome lid subunit RPN8/RPN11 [Alkalibacillus almallahensis]